MGKPQSRKGRSSKHKEYRKQRSTKNRRKDLDQIHDELLSPTVNPLQLANEDRPGMGQYYCIFCGRDFINQNILDIHTKTKKHKQRITEFSHNQKEADISAGLQHE